MCPDRIIVDNVKHRRMTCCSDADTPCRGYVGAGLKGRRPTVPSEDERLFCYESVLLSRRPLRFGAGIYHNGRRAGEAIPVNQVEAGDIAFLTTIPPEGKQRDRIVFGCYRVGRVIEGSGWGNCIESDGTMDVVVPDDVARGLFFWNYQPPNRDGTRKWGAGLFRYLEEDTTRRLIEDLLWRLGNDGQRDVVIRALGEEFNPKPNPEPRLPPGGRGQGQGGGEGDEHRNLKDLVAKHPKRIGLPKKAKPDVEHQFLSGDRVDVKFDLPDGTAAVVEVETICPLPGAHQAVKYRALLEVERGDELGAGNVQAILVAHRFDKETRDLARRYGIELVKLRA